MKSSVSPRNPCLLIVAGVIAIAFGGITSAQDDSPLGRMLQQMFGAEDDPKPSSADRHAAAASRDLIRDLRQVDKIEKEQKWPEAVETLQFLIETPEDFLVPQKGRWRSIKRVAEERLSKLPEDGRRAYRNQYEKIASDQAEAAHRSGDFSGLRDVANRYLNTTAGQRAADDIAGLLLDAGDLASACAWMEHLQEIGAPLTADEDWKLRLAEVRRRLGLPDRHRGLQPPSQTTANAKPAGEGGALKEWTMAYGGPARSATAEGDRPLLLEQWSAPLADRLGVQKRLLDLQTIMEEQGRAGIPAMQMVAVQDRVAVRTFHGVDVRSVKTGELLWRTAERFTAEQFFQSPDGVPVGLAVDQVPIMDESEVHPFTSYVYRDAVLGQLTSDGRQLFVIEQRVPFLTEEYDAYSAVNAGGQAAVAWDHSVNAITSYDFASGRRLWSIGGPRSDEPFSPALTGVYFFGPPTPADGELFAVGVSGPDVNLYCLEASTGQLQWKQLVAQYDNVDIEHDVVRQKWACLPTVTPGVVYCPTNAGWITAVDRLRHRILWSTRFSESANTEHYQPRFSEASLDGRWSASAPIASGRRLVFAPPELPDETGSTQSYLAFFNVVTGERARSTSIPGMALAGVFGSAAVILGRNDISAVSTEKAGQVLWSREYPEGATLAGQGITANGVCWVPFAEGLIVGYRLADGTVEAELRNDELRGRLGNLVLHGDRLLSAGPLGIACFWQKAPLEESLASKLKTAPADAAARLLAARVQASDHNWAAAISELDQSDVSSAAGPVAEQIETLRWEALSRLVQSDVKGQAEAWERLRQVSKTSDQRSFVARTTIERAIAAEQWQEANEAIWKLLDEESDSSFAEGPRTIKTREWLSGQLRKVWQSAGEDVRLELTNNVQRQIAAADGSPDERNKLARVFAFHPVGLELSLDLARDAAAAGRIAEADLRFRLLSKQSDLKLQAAAARGLVELWDNAGSREDALAAAGLVDGMTDEDASSDVAWIRHWMSQHAVAAGDALPRWSTGEGRMTRSGMSFGMVASWDVRIDGAPSQWIRHRRFAIEPAWDGLVCVNPATGQRDWSAALPSVGGERDGRITTTTSAGAIVLLAHEGILHAYSPIEGRELWSWIMPARFIRPMRYAWSSDDAQAAVAESPVQLTENFQSFISMNRDGPLMTIIGSRVAILGQSELIVLDLLTGAECWRRNGIAASAFAMGQDDRICVSRMSATGKSQVLLMADGEELPGVHPDAAIGRAFQISGPYLLTNEKRFGLFGSQLKVAAVDPCTGRTAWEQTFSDGTRFSRGRHEELLVARPEGAIATLNTLTGALTEVGQIPAGSLKSRPEMMLLGDRSMVYAIVGRTGGELTSYLTMPSLRVSGEVIAFQRGEKKLAWKHSIRGLNLVLTQFDSLPVLLFAGYRTEERTAGKVSMYVQAVDLLAIDRATGRDLVKWSGPMTGGSPSGLIVDPAKRRIDLTSYNERFRLEFGKGPK